MDEAGGARGDTGRSPEAADAARSPEETESDERLVEWAQAIADGRAVDWERLRAATPELAASISALRLVETVISAHRSPAALEGGRAAEAPTPAIATAAPTQTPGPAFPPLSPDAAWGPLRLLEKIGEGTYGEVFRAFDPALEVDVAVKILRRSSRDEAATETFFEEARRLARVRHPNVLHVYGAAVHDGRVGIWSELVRGRTLEDRVITDGPFGAREAAVIGIDLCSAVAAVHRAGLLHRDLKTQNVMREQGGRVVLMDFGSMSELARTPPAPGGPYGTPITVAPELLRGEAATRATDVYGLGVLLYRLVTARYPVEATSLAELVERHQRGEWTPLHEIRPDLPGGFVDVVERALNADPKRRFPGPGALERALRGTLDSAGAGAAGAGARDGGVAVGRGGVVGAGTSGALPAWLRPAGIAFATLVAIAVGLFAADLIERSRTPESGSERAPALVKSEQRAAGPSGEISSGADQPVIGAPGGALEASAVLYRQRGAAVEVLSDGGSVAAGDGLYLEIESREPIHVYAVDEDEAGRVFVLFPLAGFEPRNPLQADVRHRLPGRRNGRAENWRVTFAGGTEEVTVIASRAALGQLEQDLTRLPHAIPGAPVAGDESAPHGIQARGIGGTAPTQGAVAEPGAPMRELSGVLRALENRAARDGDVWVWALTLRGHE